MEKIKLPKFYSQWDERWGSKILGYNPPNSTYTIYNYGCLISCIAMILGYTNYSDTPHDVNEKLKSEGAFVDDTGLYIWGQTPKIYNTIKSEKITQTPNPLTDAQISEIRQSIDDGNPVILQLDYNPKTVAMEMHYVLCIGYDPSDENNFLIADPLGGIERSLKDYLGWYRPSSRNSIFQYVVYEVDAPTEQPSLHDMMIDWDDEEGNRHTCGWYEYEWYNEKVKRIALEKKHTEELNVRDNKIIALSGQIVDMGKEITVLENSKGSLSTQISDQKAKISRLETQNASLFTTSDLIGILLAKLFSK